MPVSDDTATRRRQSVLRQDARYERLKAGQSLKLNRTALGKMRTAEEHIFHLAIVPDMVDVRVHACTTFKDDSAIWVRNNAIWSRKITISQKLSQIQSKPNRRGSGRFNLFISQLMRRG